jgi:hypothetical protein
LSDSYAALPDLEVLRPQENRLSIFPNFVLQLPRIREINVAHNQLSDILRVAAVGDFGVFHCNLCTKV